MLLLISQQVNRYQQEQQPELHLGFLPSSSNIISHHHPLTLNMDSNPIYPSISFRLNPFSTLSSAKPNTNTNTKKAWLSDGAIPHSASHPE
jgi:hypothetical protein